MAPLPKNAKIELQGIPEGARVELDPLPSREATEDERATAGELPLLERAARYLRARPAAIADTAKALVTPGGGVDQAFAGKYLMGLPALSEAAIDTAPAALRSVVGGGPNVSDEWRKNLARRQAPYDEAARKEPGAALAGSLLAPSVAGKATAPQRMLSAGAQAGLEDAAHGSDPEAAAMLGAGTQGAAEGLSGFFGKTAGGLGNLAGRAAVNAAGLRGGIVNQAKRAGIPTLDSLGREEIPKLGNEMLDAGLIPFMGSKEAVLKRSLGMMDQAGAAGAAIRTRADLAGPFSQADAIRAAEERLARRIDPTKGGNLQTARAAGRAQDFIQDAAKTPDTFAAADNLKRGAYGSVNWSTEAPEAAKLKRQTVSGYRLSMEDQIDKLLPGEGRALRDVNRRYGLAAKTADFAEEAAGREASNRKLGATELALGALGFSGGAQAGGMLGGGLGGVALPLASHFAKTRGAATVAPIARLGSKAAGLGGALNQAPALSATIASPLSKYLQPDDEDAVEWFSRGGK